MSPQPQSKTNYWFVLGRQPQLAAAELKAVLPPHQSSWCGSSVLKVIAKSNLDPSQLLIGLGGTVKIGQELKAGLAANDLLQTMVQQLAEVRGKINFGISYYGNRYSQRQIRQWGLSVKKALKTVGGSSRYVAGKTTALSSVVVTSNKLLGPGVEFLITDQGKKLALAQTIVVQPFADFSRRDYGRPGRDDRSGMLPPKLAMMMINLAQVPKTKMLLDPFCGSGTILTEARLMGYKNLIGTDLSIQATRDTQANLRWLEKHHSLPKGAKIKVEPADVRLLTEKVPPRSIDAIVTEPYLGRPLKGRESQLVLEKQARELSQLYLEAFEQFYTVLKNRGVVIFIIPKFKYQNDWVKIDCLKQIKKLGFRQVRFLDKHSSILYHRPQQKLAREIFRFEK